MRTMSLRIVAWAGCALVTLASWNMIVVAAEGDADVIPSVPTPANDMNPLSDEKQWNPGVSAETIYTGEDGKLHSKAMVECCCCCPATLFEWSCCCEEEEEDDGCPEPLVTDRPDFTEASSTVGMGRVQVEIGYTYTYDESPGAVVREHSYPEALIRVGMFADWFELRLNQNFLDRSVSTGGARVNGRGAEDLSIGCKLALTEQCGCKPEMALILQATVPTGNDRLTTNEVMPGAVLLYSWEDECGFAYGFNTGINRVQDDSGHNHIEFSQSASLGVPINDSLGSYIEWYGLFPHSAIDPGASPQHFLNGGFTYLVNYDLQLDVRLGYGLNDAADDYFVGSGLSYRF